MKCCLRRLHWNVVLQCIILATYILIIICHKHIILASNFHRARIAIVVLDLSNLSVRKMSFTYNAKHMNILTCNAEKRHRFRQQKSSPSMLYALNGLLFERHKFNTCLQVQFNCENLSYILGILYINLAVFWNVAQYSLVYIHRRFRGSLLLASSGRFVCWWRRQWTHVASSPSSSLTRLPCMSPGLLQRFLHSSLFNAKFLQFLSSEILISWFTLTPSHFRSSSSSFYSWHSVKHREVKVLQGP
jgi:hypothetical protein